MKIKDLEAAKDKHTLVAFAEFGGKESNFAQPVKVVNARASRDVSNGSRSFYTHSAPGVTVEFVEGTQRGKQRTVAYPKIVGIWSEYAEARQQRLEFEAKKEQRQAMTREHAQAVVARVKARLDAAGKKYSYNAVSVVGVGGSPSPHWRAPYAYNVSIAPELVEWLIDGTS